jgi:hypothetical protein
MQFSDFSSLIRSTTAPAKTVWSARPSAASRSARSSFFERPTRIWEAIKTANLKALWIPEQKRILVDDDLHAMKKRWSFAHEIGHSILDWHRDFTFGDDQLTLVEGYHIDLEAEANYATGRLLFLHLEPGAKMLLMRPPSSEDSPILLQQFGIGWYIVQNRCNRIQYLLHGIWVVQKVDELGDKQVQHFGLDVRNASRSFLSSSRVSCLVLNSYPPNNASMLRRSPARSITSKLKRSLSTRVLDIFLPASSSSRTAKSSRSSRTNENIL